jgi:hypothetical protein
LFERFTDRARRVVVLAQEEARLLNHNYIGTEHILLGLIREGEGVAAKALESLGISLEAVRSQVEEIIGQGGQSPSGHIPFTPRAKRVLELSLRNYRIFEEVDLELPARVIGIIGPNGAGKSTLLKIVAFACYGVDAARTKKQEILVHVRMRSLQVTGGRDDSLHRSHTEIVVVLRGQLF